MAYNAALNTVYNHYLTTYAPKSTTQYDTHKKSELRSVYNSIINLNKESPLFILDTSAQSQQFAVGLKENARQFRNTVASLGGLEEADLFNKKAAYSDNEDIATATFVGESINDEEAPSFDIEVKSLANEQVNMGKFLPADKAVTLPADTYSFDININDLSYEFQYNVHAGETNKEVQQRLARLVTNADIGVNADVTEDSEGNSSLRLASQTSGLPAGKDSIFQVTDDRSSKKAGSVEYFGIDYTSRQASDASFLLNGEERTTSSNKFTVGKMYEVTLNGVSSEEGQVANIGLKTDLDSLTDNISKLVDGYNSFVQEAADYLDTHPRSSRLVDEMRGISTLYGQRLNEIGLNINDEGKFELDDAKLRAVAFQEDGLNSLSAIKEFTNSVLRKTSQVSLNPMNYVEKTVVAYKNPGHNFSTPYITSAYSGMMFNSYC